MVDSLNKLGALMFLRVVVTSEVTNISEHYSLHALVILFSDISQVAICDKKS